ncbi:DNA-deoxyinosine glycosylase [Fredinandcohnia humi]
MKRIYGLAPVAESDVQVLILGSMPGEESLRKNEYYGNKRNHFWKILFSLFEQPEITDYEEKLRFIKLHKIALWDVLYSCERVGSLDSNIKAEEPNDLESFVQTHQNLRLIACNGTKAFQSYKKYIGLHRFEGIEVVKLPSTSPVPGKYNKTLEGKLQEWEIVKKYIIEPF